MNNADHVIVHTNVSCALKMSVKMNTLLFLLILLILHTVSISECDIFITEKDAIGQTFDGIGAISGGGATSKLLVNYPEPQRSQVLDFLFKPNFGASLHILKVEIGGDSQSTDGSESSHMHEENDENYMRGYEWWLMKEAKKRNPEIKLYGLPWVFPGWLGGGKFNPFYDRDKLATYFVNWVKGAAKVHNLTIDYLGIWNERPYQADFFPVLREALNEAGHGHIQIVGGDAADWSIASDFWKYHSLLDGALDIIGIHYPGLLGYSAPKEALNSSLKLWASEEYSAYNDWKGGACWARILTSGYVNGNFTAFIAWNMITSYYDNLPYSRSSLMTANEPWSGHYVVNFPIWTTAHFTHFVKPGWRYLKYGHGSGHLPGNGTYVTLVNEALTDMAIVLETMDPAYVGCFYPMPKYTIAKTQDVQFTLNAAFSKISKLHVYFSNESMQFEKLSDINVIGGKFTLHLNINEYYTLTTVEGSIKGNYPKPPPSKTFVVPYFDNFEKYDLSSNAFNIAQQSASFEVINSTDKKHGKVLAQVVKQPPVDTCRPERMPRPIAQIGDFNWQDVEVSMDVSIPAPPMGSKGIFIAVRVNKGGCESMYADGVFLWLLPFSDTLLVTGNYSQTEAYLKQYVKLNYDRWYSISLSVKNKTMQGTLDGVMMFNLTLPTLSSTNGFVSIGTSNFGLGYFDNFAIHSAKSHNSSKEKVGKQNLNGHSRKQQYFEKYRTSKNKLLEYLSLKQKLQT